ncbi:hypothetical protein [Fructobacillus ficulneus]|uniref:Recombination factor protein RarA n=1 Tax=Fructobacillus ficulneus TaxID=157463 RepID=A0A0K8MK00_9LACO|nr:hypothetical protein [Fructobacillus ficulneus]GAP00484.1 Recombination factor protein RarA [Fructobacillus ficulneus]
MLMINQNFQNKSVSIVDNKDKKIDNSSFNTAIDKKTLSDKIVQEALSMLSKV